MKKNKTARLLRVLLLLAVPGLLFSECAPDGSETTNTSAGYADSAGGSIAERNDKRIHHTRKPGKPTIETDSSTYLPILDSVAIQIIPLTEYMVEVPTNHPITLPASGPTNMEMDSSKQVPADTNDSHTKKPLKEG